MNIIYLFCESNLVRIPFYYYNERLSNLFKIQGGGFLDKTNREFIFNRDIDAEKLSQLLPNIPIVKVTENSEEQPKVFNFIGYALDDKIDNEPINSPFIFPKSPSLHEKFSKLWLEQLETELRSRKYSLNTQKAYIYYNRLICHTLQKTPEEIRPNDITEFLALMERDKDYSSSAMNLAISGIKFFFRNVVKNDIINEHHRPRQDKNLPTVLSKEEVCKILSLEKNPKHRLLLMLVYSSGLRVSEVVALKKEYIDLSRKVVFIKNGKGRKDRSTLLSEKAAQFIEEYYEVFGIEKWLFTGYPSNRPLSIRSAQYIFEKAARNAGITKRVTIHGLRHSFATHLLEGGTDIRYIQTLLGHANIRTTERYTHVARRSVLSIKSPLDTML